MKGVDRGLKLWPVRSRILHEVLRIKRVSNVTKDFGESQKRPQNKIKTE